MRPSSSNAEIKRRPGGEGQKHDAAEGDLESTSRGNDDGSPDTSITDPDPAGGVLEHGIGWNMLLQQPSRSYVSGCGG